MDMNASANAVNQTAAAITALGQIPWADMLKYLGLGLIGLLTSVTGQHWIEAAISHFNPPTIIKALMPTGLGLIVGGLLKWLGADQKQALEAAAGLAGMMHVINETALGSAVASRVKQSLPDDLKNVAGAFMLVALLGLGAGLKAEVNLNPAPIAGWCAGPGLWAGSSLYQANGSGLLEAHQVALGGVEFAGYIGSWTGDQFTPTYTLGVIGAMATTGPVNRPAVGVTGGFYLNGVPMTIFWAKELTADAGGSLWGVGTSVQFSGWVPFLYLGKPGN